MQERPDLFQDILIYIQNNYKVILIQTKDHLIISFISVFIAAIIGIIFGYLASKSSRGESFIATPFEALRVIPSLALLALFIPFIGTGAFPAIIALTILAIPPILLNTIVGFKEVPYFMIETAQGMGMTKKQEFWKVRVPLATPVIMSGIRTAIVEVIASATLATKIGAGGLGEIIFTGLGLNRVDLLIVGGVAVALLSLVCGFLFDLLSRKILRYKYI